MNLDLKSTDWFSKFYCRTNYVSLENKYMCVRASVMWNRNWPATPIRIVNHLIDTLRSGTKNISHHIITSHHQANTHATLHASSNMFMQRVCVSIIRAIRTTSAVPCRIYVPLFSVGFHSNWAWEFFSFDFIFVAGAVAVVVFSLLRAAVKIKLWWKLKESSSTRDTKIYWNKTKRSDEIRKYVAVA